MNAFLNENNSNFRLIPTGRIFFKGGDFVGDPNIVASTYYSHETYLPYQSHLTLKTADLT
eukprot:snap_masked-scaffold_40-processed-gene-1.18-mRNA-1 protein AED:1.00 eAED:1.00 QI:0/0/0/0/1/1/2/0/59